MASSTTKPTDRIKRHHGQVVQAVLQQVHDCESSDDRERQRQARNDSGRHVAQEQENHRDHQAEGQQHGELHVFVGFPDRVGTIVENIHVDRGRKLFPESRQKTLDIVGHLDGIRSGLALNRENDGALFVAVGVEPGRSFIILDVVDHIS